MLSDRGVYPDGMMDGDNFIAYDGIQDALVKVATLLHEPEKARIIGRKAANMIRSRYSKAGQWQQFQALVATI
jgi:hypothetical protein